MAAIFCRRAQGFLDIQECSVRLVQSYLLLALYFQSMGESRMCWLYVGNAIRTAQMLELHLPETSERIAKSQARNSLRKAWHSCVLMDREVSMLYGRPSMIDPQAATAIPLPLIAEDDNYQPRHNEENTIETRQTYISDFFKSCLGLYDILYAVLLDLRHSKSDRNLKKGRSTSENISSAGTSAAIFNLQERHSDWERDNPEHLRIEQHPTYHDLNAELIRQAVVLHQRHLHIQLLLLTPVLQQLIRTEFPNKAERIRLGSLLSHRISLQYAIVCVKIAQEAIDTIHLRETSGSNEISPWWCNVIFLYKSATVLIAGGLCPSIVAEISETAIHESFSKATAILRQYTTFTSPPTPDDDNSAATFQYWYPIKPIRHAASAHQDTVLPSPENSGSSQILTDLDRRFDTVDFTWLTKMPFDT
ncbi:uncharacterized protein EAF02_006069 [Botrytis sinoallii]|uniref:uncharacterized protein n=1 Tax=Botrytis sinoallii TaxID=1463999 RepID=UPI0019025007|nr:uncharacterized protein EAF02_006069 [Botrytis sinoallii]KAF7882706.1 hypothetical protein EAF02_006069 [Botrytis sinoallii]